MKSSSCPPSHQKPRHALIVLQCPQATRSSLAPFPVAVLAGLCMHTGRSTWSLEACGTGILIFLFLAKASERALKNELYLSTLNLLKLLLTESLIVF